MLRKWAEDEPEVIAEADDGRDNGGQAEGCEHLVDESPLLVRAEVLEPDDLRKSLREEAEQLSHLYSGTQLYTSTTMEARKGT